MVAGGVSFSTWPGSARDLSSRGVGEGGAMLGMSRMHAKGQRV